MKIVRNVAIGLLLLILVLGLGAYWWLNSSQPQYEGSVTLEGLKTEVEVYYDTYGIPHIYADNLEDSYYALGYVHAQDRLFQMEMLRRVGGGQLSEILGPDLVDTDRFLRTMGINEMAKLSAETYLSSNDEPFQKAAFAYLRGLNAFIKTGPTPPEFTLIGIDKKPFEPADLYRIAGYMGFSFQTAIRTDPLMTKIAHQLDSVYLLDLKLHTTSDNTSIPTYQQEDTTGAAQVAYNAMTTLQNLPLPAWTGSNSWVIAGRKSKSGLPLLANDTHIGFQQPAVWYEAHLNTPDLNFYGNHLAGFPFALVGHNDFSAWGLTIFPNDDMDFYRERQNPEEPDQVWNRDHWETLDIRKETIKVKDGDPVVFEVRSSRHGPIINDVIASVDSIEQQPISFFWTYLKFPNKALQMAYNMEHSKSMDSFRAAVALLEAPGLNVTYADRDGNIAWWAAARLIQRPDHVDSKLILDGASGLDDPLGWYDFSANPRSENPSTGYVYSANNQPDSAYGRLHSGYYYPGARGARIMELLAEKNDWDIQSMGEMIMDDQSPIYPEIAKAILSYLDGELSSTEQSSRDILQQWSGTHDLQAVGPTIYYRVMYELQKEIFLDELGPVDFQTYVNGTLVSRRSLIHILKKPGSPWWDHNGTAVKETAEQIVNKSFRSAVAQLEKTLGSDPQSWTWDRVHLLEHQHVVGRRKPFNKLFNVGPAAVTGGDEVINKMNFDKDDSIYAVGSGPAMRILIDLADIENSLSVLPTGQSGHPMSPHYQDQAPLYNSGQFRAQMMDQEQIKASSKLLLLKPLIE